MHEETFESIAEDLEECSSNGNSSKISGSRSKNMLPDLFDSENTEEEMDHVQKSLSRIKDPAKLRYVSIMMQNPTLSDKEVSIKLSCDLKTIRKFKSDSQIQSFLSLYFREQIKYAQVREAAQLEKHSAILDEEIDYRLQQMKKKRIDAEDLFNQDYSVEQAKLILAGRFEGLSTKDLLTSRSVLAERTAKLRNVVEESSSKQDELIEEISINFRKYSQKKNEVNPESFAPDADEFVIEG